MDALPGFVSIPRQAGLPRPAGAFFSAEVLRPSGPGLWVVRIESREVTARLEGAFPGQSLRLQSVGLEGGRWYLRVLGSAIASPSTAPAVSSSGLGPSLGRALGTIGTTLGAWKTWLSAPRRPSDASAWAADLQARDAVPGSAWDQALQPWLGWLADLEQGRPRTPPENEEFWDLWNGLQRRESSPWLAQIVHWEYGDRPDHGLLQARWNEAAQTIDRWQLTAAPAGIAFRLEAESRGQELSLFWHLSDPDARRQLNDLTVPGALGPGVSLRFAGGLDVQA